MFELIFPSAKDFKLCVDAISTLIDEGMFDVSDAGLCLRAMDPAQIAMVDFIMPKSSFEKFNADPSQFGVNLEDLARLMARVRPDEKLAMKLDESGTRLVLTFKGKATRRFVMPLLDLGTKPPREPSIEFESIANFNGTFLKDSLKDAQLVSAHVVMSAQPDAFVLESKGDKGEVNVRAEKDSDAIFDYKVTKPSRAMFPLEYLNNLLKPADAATNVQVNLRSDAPLKIQYKIADATITYYLAPRIETQ